MPSNALSDQIQLLQQNSHTYTAGYDAEWTIGPGKAHFSQILEIDIHTHMILQCFSGAAWLR